MEQPPPAPLPVAAAQSDSKSKSKKKKEPEFQKSVQKLQRLQREKLEKEKAEKVKTPAELEMEESIRTVNKRAIKNVNAATKDRWCAVEKTTSFVMGRLFKNGVKNVKPKTIKISFSTRKDQESAYKKHKMTLLNEWVETHFERTEDVEFCSHSVATMTIETDIAMLSFSCELFPGISSSMTFGDLELPLNNEQYTNEFRESVGLANSTQTHFRLCIKEEANMAGHLNLIPAQTKIVISLKKKDDPNFMSGDFDNLRILSEFLKMNGFCDESWDSLAQNTHEKHYVLTVISARVKFQILDALEKLQKLYPADVENPYIQSIPIETWTFPITYQEDNVLE